MTDLLFCLFFFCAGYFLGIMVGEVEERDKWCTKTRTTKVAYDQCMAKGTNE